MRQEPLRSSSLPPVSTRARAGCWGQASMMLLGAAAFYLLVGTVDASPSRRNYGSRVAKNDQSSGSATSFGRRLINVQMCVSNGTITVELTP